ncbi:MAG: hypothetical protein M3A44_10970 [Gammaproteobacteria bacterium]
MKFSIESEHANQLLAWHATVVELLVALRNSAKNNKDEERRSLLVRLSALIEQGRFYFPNIDPDGYGAEKPPAYRGYRNIALDFLVASYNLHHKTYTERIEKQAVYLQKLFTSVVFEVVRPAERLVKIHNLADHYFVKDLSVENLEEQEQIDAISHMWDRPRLR